MTTPPSGPDPPTDPTAPGPSLPGGETAWPRRSGPDVQSPPFGQPPYYGAADHRAPAYPDPPSKATAAWALGLAIVPCGVGWLVSIGLGITVLVRSRDGRNHGKGIAIAALVVAPLWIIGSIVGGVVVGVMPCSQPHQFQVYLTFDLPDGEYPGEGKLSRLAGRRCLGAFTDFVGVTYGRSRLEPYVLYPQPNSWRILDDRGITCIVGEPGRLTTGTLAGSRR